MLIKEFRRYFLLVKCALLSFVGCTQIFEPIWINYNTDSGLPSSETYEILQGHKGYIWISTDNGLSRFDGYGFKNFGPVNGLKDPVVFHLSEDSNGLIWMNTLSKYIYFYQNDTIQPYKYNYLLNKYYDSPYDIENFIISDNRLLYESKKFGVLEFNEEGKIDIIKSNSFPSLNVVSLKNKSLIALELAKDNNELHSWEFYTNKVFNLNFFNHNRLINKTTLLFEYKKIRPPTIFSLNDNVKIISLNFKIYVYKNEKLISIISNLEGIFISAYQDESGIIYICNNNGKGLRVYNNLDCFLNGKFQTFLKGESVSYITKDKSGGFWAATNNNGIFYAKDLNITLLKNISLINKDDITAFSNIDNNNFYLGYQSGAIWNYNILEGKFTKLKSTSSLPINDIFFDGPKKRVYISNKEGTFLFENNKWKEISIYYQKDRRTTLPLKRIWSKNEVNDIIGSTERGFFKINKNINKAYYFSNFSTKEKIPIIRTLCAFKSVDNQLLIGTVKGLYEVKNDSLYKVIESDPSLSLRIEAIDQLTDKTLIVGTKGDGILFINNGRVSKISEKDGLTSNMIENIYVDSDNNIWVGTLLGLNRVFKDKTIWHVEKLTIHNGLPSNEIIKVQSNNGIIWCLTNKGLVRIKDRIPDKLLLPVLISELFVNDKKIKLGYNYQFTHFENNIRLKLDCLNFKMLGKIPFRFKLRKEDEWRQTYERNINLYSLPPGFYNLQIQAKNADGIWSKSSILTFTILPPWWNTWQFYLIVIIVFIGIAGWVIYLRIRNLNRKLDIQKQMNELEQAAKKAQMNPHFLFNTLNSVQSQIITGNLEEATHFLSSFGHLVRGVLDMSIKKSISLKTELDYLNKYLELEQMRFKNRFLYEIKVDDQIDLEYTFIAPMLVQPFVENSIIHGISKIEQQGIINISFNRLPEYLEVVIKDNGIGFKYNSNARRSLEKSVGISNTKRRLELLDEMKIKDLLKIEEIIDQDGTITGTKVTLLIKLITKF